MATWLLEKFLALFGVLFSHSCFFPSLLCLCVCVSCSFSESSCSFLGIIIRQTFLWWKMMQLSCCCIIIFDDENRPFCHEQHYRFVTASTTSRETEKERRGTIFIVEWIWIRLPRFAVNEINYSKSKHTLIQTDIRFSEFFSLSIYQKSEHAEMAHQHTPPPKRRSHRIINNCQRKSIKQLNLNMQFIII